MLSKSRVSSVEYANGRFFGRRATKQRQRFTPWLEEQIDHGDIEGLEWMEKDQGIFKVPWVRVDKPEFEIEIHAELFKRWAQHTGKYRPGDQPDPSTWKTRFRCALRKMQEIVEIRKLGSLEGSKPYRAFKFVPKLKEGNSSSRRSLSGKIQRRRRSSSSAESTSSIETCDSGEQPMQSYWNNVGMNEWDNRGQNTQYLDFPDIIDPAMADWDIYFPEGVRNQFGFSAGSGYGLRDQEPNYFDLQAYPPWPSCLMQEGFNAALYSEIASYTVPQFEAMKI